MIEKNGLKLVEINSKTECISEISDPQETIKLFNSEGYVIAYLTYGVYIGLYRGDSFNFYEPVELIPDYILRLRLFNEQKELYIWKTGDKLKARLRIDTEGEKTYAVDAYQILWGTDVKNVKEGWSKIFEERGTELILPFHNLTVDNRKKRIFIKTRNYIDFHPISHIATYYDCRFVGFYNHHRNLL